jgi:hypothetical protein
MTLRLARGAVPAPIASLVTATALALAVGGLHGTDRAAGAEAPQHQHHHQGATVAPARAAKARALYDAMRELWEDHIVWTRPTIVSFADDLPDLPETSGRLLRNQTDIGDAVRPYHGRRAGDRLTALLQEHIAGAVALLGAAKSGDGARLQGARAAWYDNADRIAAFLSAANPRSWARPAMRAMMRTHLDDTVDEALARLQHRYRDDIRAYARIHRHIVMTADALSAGIIRQFPRRFR